MRTMYTCDYISTVDKYNKKKAEEESFAARKDSLWNELVSFGLEEPPF